MDILPKSAVDAYIRGIATHKLNQQTSDNGEIVVHTGLYKWDDNTIRNAPQGRSLLLTSEEEEEEYENVESEDVYDSEPATLRSNQLGRVG